MLTLPSLLFCLGWPIYLLRLELTPPALKNKQQDDGTVFIVTFGDDELSRKINRQEWIFDRAGQLKALKYVLPDNSDANWVTYAEDRFSDFREVNGIRIPFVIETHIAAKLFRTIRLEAAAVNSGVTVVDWREQ